MADLSQLAQRMFAAISKGDEEAIREGCSPQVVHVEVGATQQGIDSVAPHFKALATACPDLEIVVERQLEAGSTVVSEMRFIGTHTGPLATPLGEVAPSGRRVDVPGCVVHTTKDGLITEHRGYYDQLTFMAQLGLLPSPATA